VSPSKKDKRRAQARAATGAASVPAAHGLDAKALTLICGGAKQVRSPMDKGVYDEALAYREDYLATRRIVLPMGIAKDRKKS